MFKASWVSSPKDCVFPETIPEEASSLEEERVVIFRLPASSNIMDQSFYTVNPPLHKYLSLFFSNKNLKKKNFRPMPVYYNNRIIDKQSQHQHQVQNNQCPTIQDHLQDLILIKLIKLIVVQPIKYAKKILCFLCILFFFY